MLTLMKNDDRQQQIAHDVVAERYFYLEDEPEQQTEEEARQHGYSGLVEAAGD